MKKLLVTAMAVALLFTVAGSLMADDFAPPSWRGLPGSTWQQWEFNTGQALGILPDHGYNPYGTPSATVVPALGEEWLQSYECRIGVWPLSGTIDALIPNQPISNPYKDIWIQLTWRPGCALWPMVTETRFGLVANLVSHELLPDCWYHSIYSLRIQPNPDWENIRISEAIFVDQLVIDTRCVPEPSGIAVMLAGLTGLGGFVRLRRKSR